LSNVNTSGLMDNYLTTLNNFPLISPYNAPPFSANFIKINEPIEAKITPNLLSQTGNNAIVDWVFVELRNGVSGATQVIQTKSALLQRDGDIVETDGKSALAFSLPTGAYFVTIRHRNHLGFRTLGTYSLTQMPTNLNFTNQSVALFGTMPINISTPNRSFMLAGDSNSDGSIDAIDSSIWELENGGFDNYYALADYNIDGSVDAIDSALWELNNGSYQELD
jgi:hypothetical protein